MTGDDALKAELDALKADEDSLEARQRALRDFQRHSAEGLEPGAEGVNIGAKTAESLRLQERPLGVKVPKDLSEARFPAIFYVATHDRGAAVRRAMWEEPNVYVRRARKALGLRPTGNVYRDDLLRLPFGCQLKLLRVGALASPEPPPVRKRLSTWQLYSLMAAGLFGLTAAFYLSSRGK